METSGKDLRAAEILRNRCGKVGLRYHSLRMLADNSAECGRVFQGAAERGNDLRIRPFSSMRCGERGQIRRVIEVFLGRTRATERCARSCANMGSLRTLRREISLSAVGRVVREASGELERLPGCDTSPDAGRGVAKTAAGQRYPGAISLRVQCELISGEIGLWPALLSC